MTNIATRPNIALAFNTDELTTHRILMNLNWGFFQTHFGENAQMMWEAAHPFLYPSGHKNFTEIDIQFIRSNFELFASYQFTTSAGWELNEKTRKCDWVYHSYYRTEPINYN